MRFLKNKTPLLKIALGLGVMAVFSVAAGQSASNASPEEVTLQIIVVGSPEEAQHILDQLKKGESFAALAKEKSIDSTAEEGGLMGSVALSMLRPELRDALRGLASGDVSAAVRTTLGYAILKVVNGSSGKTNSGGSSATAATGSVKYVFNVGGLGEAELGLTRAPKASTWSQDLRQICATRKQSLAAEKESLKSFLSPANQKARASYARVDVLMRTFPWANSIPMKAAWIKPSTSTRRPIRSPLPMRLKLWLR
jgi:PPIC-type PPIASE domain